MHVVNNVWLCKRECRRNPNSNTLECDIRQNDRPVSLCYRPAVFLGHLRALFHSRKQEVGARFKISFLFFFTLGRITCLKLRNSRAARIVLLCAVYCRARIPSIHSWIKDEHRENGVLGVSGFQPINLASFPFNFHHFHHRCGSTQLSC
jgi:hypothetical protein